MGQQPDREPPPFIRELLLAEYQSLRQESEQARTAQQTILNWSMGSLSVLVAAGVSQLDGTSEIHPGVGLLFGVAIPAFLAAAALIWIGELARMERAGFFLRRWERLRWHTDASGALHGPTWENYLSFNPANDPGKHLATYIGGMLLYGGGVVASFLIFLATHDELANHGSSFGILISHPNWTVGVMIVTFSSACLYFGLPVLKLGENLAATESLSPSEYPEPD